MFILPKKKIGKRLITMGPIRSLSYSLVICALIIINWKLRKIKVRLLKLDSLGIKNVKLFGEMLFF